MTRTIQAGLAGTRGLGLVDLSTLDTGTYAVDGIHPGPAGQAVIAQELLAVIG